MKKVVSKSNLFLYYTLLLMVVISCDISNEEEDQAEHDRAIANFKDQYGITEADHIGDGIYVHFTSIPDINAVKPAADDFVVLDLVGFDAGFNVFEVTNYDAAVSHDVDRPDYVYGPLRIGVAGTFPGFNKAIQKMPEGSEAVAIFPHDQAFGGYEPILYEIALHRVITDYTSYIGNEFHAYRQLLGMELTDTIGGYDSVFYKIVTEDTTSHSIELGNLVTIKLHAYYAECDTAYVDSFPGRSFFPINNSGDSIEFEFGLLSFPVTDAVHIAVANMNLGEVWELLTPPKYAYGNYGFLHPLTYVTIVPIDMPVHYTIELVGYKKPYY